MTLDLGQLMDRSEEIWESSILPSLSDFIEIKALSPLFEPNWAEMGELDATIELFCEWLDDQGIEGMSYEKHRIGKLSPVLIVTIEGTGPGEVIFYSHLDKQPSKPELWSEGLHPSDHSSGFDGCLSRCCLLYTSPSPRDRQKSRMPSSA